MDRSLVLISDPRVNQATVATLTLPVDRRAVPKTMGVLAAEVVPKVTSKLRVAADLGIAAVTTKRSRIN